MKATLILSEKTVFADGAIRQVKVWLVPEPVLPSSHRFKYSLVYIVQGVRVIGFDNERGKEITATYTVQKCQSNFMASNDY